MTARARARARARGDPKLFVVPHRRVGESLADSARLDVDETQKSLIYHVETRNAKIVARIRVRARARARARGRTWRVISRVSARDRDNEQRDYRSETRDNVAIDRSGRSEAVRTQMSLRTSKLRTDTIDRFVDPTVFQDFFSPIYSKVFLEDIFLFSSLLFSRISAKSL